MHHNKLTTIVLFTTLLLLSATACGQQVATLRHCRQLALQNNRQLAIAQSRVAQTDDLRQMALCQFFPTLSANGAYMWNQKNLQLLSTDQQQRLNTMGTTLQQNVTNSLADAIPADLAFLRQLITRIGTTNTAEELNNIGRDITSALNIDMTHLFAGAVSVAQPVYMGGKLRALYNTARLANEIASVQADKEADDIIVSVDEAYWRIISLTHKQQLAQQYYDLLTKLCDDVDAMVQAEVATMADMTKVRVKQNEAQMSLTKATVGLTLSRMVLNQICGLPLDSIYTLSEEAQLVNYRPLDTINMTEVYANRNEIKMLELSKAVAGQGVKAAISTLLPNIGLTGSYVVSNPNLYNGFQKSFGGMFTAGVVVNVPLCHPDAFFAVRAAKHKYGEVELQIDDARDKIALQVNKLNYELQVAGDKLSQSQSNLSHAEANLTLADESFKSGLLSAGDLMQAQTAWMQAKTEVLDAEIEMQMSYTYLQQALGNLRIEN